MLDSARRARLKSQQSGKLYRQRQLSLPEGPRLTCVNGERCLNFSANDYLGLSHEESLKRAYQEGIEQYGFTSGGAALIAGHHPPHQALEDAFAEFLGRERAVFFPSGYTANLAVISGLLSEHSDVLMDKLSHASVYDGLKLARAKTWRFRHCSIEHARLVSDKLRRDDRWLLSESIFSMSGRLANIPALIMLAKEKRMRLIIDDAHGLGVLGERGQGCLGLEGVSAQDIEVLISPLGKAFASNGAIVSGAHEWIEYLINFARPYIYSTAASPAQLHGLLATLRMVERETWRREKLQENVAYFREKMKQSPYRLLASQSPIQIIALGDSGKALALSQFCRARQIFCIAVRPPTVSARDAGLRVVLNCSHETSDIDDLIETLYDFEASLPHGWEMGR